MTETTDTATTVDNTVDDTAAVGESPTAKGAVSNATLSAEEGPSDDQSDDNREAAKYRRKLRDTETERDALSERLATLQRAEVERLANQHLADGADFWRDGAVLEDVLDDDGGVDADKVTEVAKRLLESHRHWRKSLPAAPPASTVTADGKITGDQPGNTFEDAFRPRKG